MKNRSLKTMFILVVLGMFCFSTSFAEDKKTWCSVNSQTQYLVGEFNGDSSGGGLEQKNISLGIHCNYSRRSWLTLSTESAFSYGTLNISYVTDSLSGSANYRTIGLRESLGTLFTLSEGVKLSVLAGVEIINAYRFQLEQVSYDFGNGPLDLTWLATGHLSSSGRMETGSVETSVEIDSWWKHISFIFGGSFQRIHMVFRFEADQDTLSVLKAFNVGPEKVNRVIDKYVNSPSIVPGIKWTGENFRFLFKFNGGLISKDKWFLGGAAQVELKF